MNFIYQIPYFRKLYIDSLKKWAQNNSSASVNKRIYKGIKMNLLIRDWVQYHLFINAIYEPNETKLWFKLSEKYSTIYDVGANVGYYSLLAAKANPEARIFAFEPINKTFHKLMENISLNDFNNITAIKKGVSDVNKSITLNVGNDNNWGMSSINEHDHLSGEVETIDCVSIDEFVADKQHQKVDMIKIDIEGSEYNALQGMIKTISRDKPDIFIEVLDEHLHAINKSCKDIYKQLWEHGYSAYHAESGKLQLISEPLSKNGLVYFTQKNN